MNGHPRLVWVDIDRFLHHIGCATIVALFANKHTSKIYILRGGAPTTPKPIFKSSNLQSIIGNRIFRHQSRDVERFYA